MRVVAKGTGAGRGQNRALAFGLLAAASIGALAVAARAGRERRRISLVGRRVLITGGSRGLGLVIARKLARLGARVALLARDAESLERARNSLLAAIAPIPADVYTVVADVAGDADSLTDAVRRAETLFGGPIDILINNAGTILVGPCDTMTESDFREAMQTNFWGPLHLIQAVLPSMRRRQWKGRIVNIASIGGKIAVPHLLAYCASKFALVGLSEGLRAELAHEGIIVTTVCPGLTRTGSPRNARFKGQHQKEYAWFALSDSLPILSTSAERCADQIIDALRHGDADLVTSLPGKAGALLHGIAPGMIADLLGRVNAYLPTADGAGNLSHSGDESETMLTLSPFTALTRLAESRNNQR